MIAKSQNFIKLRNLLDPNKYSDEIIMSYLNNAYSFALSYTNRESLPDGLDNNDIFSITVALINKTSLVPCKKSLSKYVIQRFYNGYSNVIFVSSLPSPQEKDQIYAIRNCNTTEFYRNGELLDVKTNQDDDSPYTAGTGISIEDNVISSTSVYDNYENQEFPNGGD